VTDIKGENKCREVARTKIWRRDYILTI